MTYKYAPAVEDAAFDDNVWDEYIDLFPDNFEGSYEDFFKQRVDGVVTVCTGMGGAVIEYIDFESEQHYTMFLLKWT